MPRRRRKRTDQELEALNRMRALTAQRIRELRIPVKILAEEAGYTYSYTKHALCCKDIGSVEAFTRFNEAVDRIISERS